MYHEFSRDGSRGISQDRPPDSYSLTADQVRSLGDQLLPSLTAKLYRQAASQPADFKRPRIHGTDQSDFQDPHSVDLGDRLDPSESERDKVRTPSRWFRSIVRSIVLKDRDAHAELCTPWSEGGFGVRVNTGRTNSAGEPEYTRSMVESLGSTGGYTTPTVYEAQVFEVASEESVLVSRADSRPLGARTVKWPALNQYIAPTKGQGAWYGGMQVFRKNEDAARSEKDVNFDQIEMTAFDLTAYTELTRDLVMDSSISIDNYVVKMMGRAIGWREDWEAFNGTGDGQFLGILASQALLPVARHDTNDVILKSTTWIPNPITALDIFEMLTHLVATARDPVWFCHPFTLKNLQKIQDATGRFLFIPYTTATPADASNPVGGGIAYRPSGTLMGLPVYRTEKVPPPSASTNTTAAIYGPLGELLLVDCQSYLVGRRAGLEVGLSEHFKFQNDLICIRAKVRNDGKPGQLKPIPLSDGAATTNYVSGFVALARGVTGP